MAEPTVRMSGIVLASLMFQHLNSDSDVEGLILGESRFDEHITISDSQADHIHIEETYSTFPTQYKYCTLSPEDVIGWYRQRRNTDQQMTLREKLVHENLKSALSNPHMIFVLLTPSKLTPAGSTHRMEYAAFISRSRQFLNVPVLVNNLGLLEQLAYWKVSAPCSAAGYNLTMKKHGSRFFCSSGLLREVNKVNEMNDALQSELQKACRDVEESERLLETLQLEVSALRRRVREKQQDRAGQGTLPSAFSGYSADGPAEQKNNLLLHEAVRALFACAPLFHTQTLTPDAFPVPAGCCGSEQDDNSLSLLNPSRTNCQKRLKETPPERERKRRKNFGVPHELWMFVCHRHETWKETEPEFSGRYLLLYTGGRK
uniref:Abraxas 1, BRCA1 A complex subunit n=1 Tax=Mastacembelus armatus TaxID=205130 RepID=A0A3Q3M6Q9_9TELE